MRIVICILTTRTALLSNSLIEQYSMDFERAGLSPAARKFYRLWNLIDQQIAIRDNGWLAQRPSFNLSILLSLVAERVASHKSSDGLTVGHRKLEGITQWLTGSVEKSKSPHKPNAIDVSLSTLRKSKEILAPTAKRLRQSFWIGWRPKAPRRSGNLFDKPCDGLGTTKGWKLWKRD